MLSHTGLACANNNARGCLHTLVIEGRDQERGSLTVTLLSLLGHVLKGCSRVFLRPNFGFLFGDVVHGLGEVADVGRGDSGDGDAAVLGEVHAVVGDDLLDLQESG